MSKTNFIEVNKNTLSKTFVRKEGLYKELSGLTLLKNAKTNTPSLLGVGEKKCITTYIINGITSYEAIGKRLVTIDKVNGFILEHISNLQELDSSETWDRFCRSVLKKFTSNSGLLKMDLGIELYLEIKKGIVKSTQKSVINKAIKFLHGDLHLGNILFDTKINEFWIIDFEHSKYGPVEYEFVNSYFWNDGKSLDIGYFSQKIKGFDKGLLKEMKKLYMADQLNIALELNDRSKIKELVKQYKKRLL
jgi:hypothetical protein